MMNLLSPRQAQVLSLSAQGKNRQQIAKTLFLSPWTVDNLFKAARESLGDAGTNEQALARAIATEQLILDHEGHVTAPIHIKQLLLTAA